MSVKRKKRNGVLIVAVIVLLVFVAGLLFSVTNGFSSGIKTFALKRNGKELIVNDTYGMKFSSEEKFEIVNLTNKAREFSVKVYAYGTEESDFEYTYGQEEGYTWKDFSEEEQRDFTACFDFEFTENALTFRHEGFKKTVEKYDPLIVLPSSVPKGDRFVLEISCGEDKISLGFYLYAAVTGVTLSPEELVFGK